MSTSDEQLGKCQRCGGRIDDRRELGIIEWRHCRDCGSWSAYPLPEPPSQSEQLRDKPQRSERGLGRSPLG